MSRYVTTAIPYVNAAPHLGFALELVQADVLARHARLRDIPVRFLTGTDDNAFKNVTAARAAGVDVRTFVDTNAQRFVDLGSALGVSNDDFIRTSVDPRHARGVARLWELCGARGDFYQRSYSGLYCLGCEQFLDAATCAEHTASLEQVTETNWFFRLSRYRPHLLDLITNGQVRIEPVQRRNEVLGFLRGEVQDISVSRPAARSGGWGIPVPGDPDQVIYVWWDALGNYITALDLDSEDYSKWWVASRERIHVIGKGIVRFHAVYWLALLLSAGLPLPTQILVHDYVTVAGAKLSKSNATGFDPLGLIADYGGDAVRWWLLSDVARLGDTDFTLERLVDRANSDLANGVGNLVQRTLGLIRKYTDGVRIGPALDGALPRRIDAALEIGDFRAAAGAIRDVVDAANRFVEESRPWEPGSRLETILAALLSTCHEVATELGPFLPHGAQRLRRLLAGERLEGPVFPRIRTHQGPR